MAERTRQKRFDLHLDEEEDKLLRVLAKQCGKTKSDLLRFVIRNGIVPPFRKAPRVRA